MKKLLANVWMCICLFLTAARSFGASSSVYDLVAPAPLAPLVAGEEQKKPIVPTLKLSGGIDFESAKGTSSSLDLELGGILPPFKNKMSLSPGVVLGIKDNDESTAWKAGGQVRLEFPAYNQVLSPYLKAALVYQDPDSDAKSSMVGSGGIGLSFLIARNDCFKSALEVELTYSKASEDIYDDDTKKVDDDITLTLGLKLFLF